MSSEEQRPDASAFVSARPEADLEGRLVLEAMRGAMFGRREKPVSVGRYELIERLGSGALGLVVAARDPELDRRVAIKLLPARVDSRKLLREARALARLSSPYVVAMLDVGTFEPSDIGTLFGGDPGDPAGTGVWLAMELVDGVSLDAWIGKGPHPWREVLRVFGEAAQGLADAHDARIVHRDFKPANVILGNDNRVRVVDFGLARSPNLSFMTSADAAAAADDAALLRGLIGTPAYMSPEQHKGEPTDERADQFSFCVSLFEALFGELPYPGPRYEDFMRDKIEGAPPIPTEPVLPVEIRRALTRGLDPDPAKRFDSMRSLLVALTPSTAAPQGKSGKWVVAGLLSAGVLGAGYLAYATRVDCQVPPAELEAWSASKAELVRVVSAAEVPYAKVAAFRISEVFEGHHQAWAKGRERVCAIDPNNEASADCFVVAQRGMEAASERLAQMVPERLAAVEAVLDAIPDPTRCADLERSGGAAANDKSVGLQHRVLVAQMQARGGDAAAAALAADAARSAAEDLGVPEVAAAAALVAGEASIVAGEPAAAAASLQSAHALATEAGATSIAARAAATALDAMGTAVTPDAETWIERAEAALESADARGAVDALLAVARIRMVQGRVDEAVAHYERARTRVDADLSGRAPDRELRSHGALADALAAKGNHDEAMARAERALTIAETGFGPGHPRLLGALTRLGRIALARGRARDAESHLRRAMKLLDGGAATSDAQRADVMMNLANAVARRGGDREAADLLRESLDLELPPAQGVEVRALMCQLLAASGALEPARTACEATLERIAAMQDGDPLPAIQARAALGDVLLRLGELDEADRHLDAGQALADKSFGPGHPAAARLLLAMARVRHEQKRDDEAVALLDRVAALAATLGASDPIVVSAIVRRAWLMADAGKGDDALAVVRAHLQQADADLSAADRFELRFAEAAALASTGQGTEATRTARQAREAYARADGASPEALARVDDWLAQR